MNMFTQFQVAEDGYVKEPTSLEGGASGTTGTVVLETLTEDINVTLFGREIELKTGTNVLIKKCRNTFSLDGQVILNTQEWEAIFQNKAAEKGLAPLIYGFDNDRDIVVMEPLEKTLADKITEVGGFNIEDQCQYLALMHELDKIGILHNDYKLDNFMFDKNGVLKAIDFGLAKPIDQVLMYNKGYSPNIINCRARLKKERVKHVKGQPRKEGRAYLYYNEYLDAINSTVEHAQKLASFESVEMEDKDPTEDEIWGDEDAKVSRLDSLRNAREKLVEIGPIEKLEFIQRGQELRNKK